MSNEALIKEFNLDKVEEEVLKERMISIRLPESYKLKYDSIQSRSRRRYAEYIRALVMSAIDRVDVEKVG